MADLEEKEGKSYYEIDTPEEAWGGVAHFLGNHLMAIGMVFDEKVKDWERKVSSHKAMLVGYLWVLTDRMRKSGHADVAEKIGILLEMAAYSDLTDRAVRKSIFAKHTELDPDKAAFSAEIARLNAEAAAKRSEAPAVAQE